MRRFAAPLLGASAALSVLAGPATAALADDDPLLKERMNNLCLAPTQTHSGPDTVCGGHPGTDGSRTD